MMASKDPEQPDRIIDVIDVMRDSFATYLEPKFLLNFIPSMDGKVTQELLTYAESHESQETMYKFLNCLVGHDVSRYSKIEFYQVMRLIGEKEVPDSSLEPLISSEGLSIWKSIPDLANLFVDLVEGHKFDKVSGLSIQKVLAVLTDCKMVESSYKGLTATELEPRNAFMDIFRSIQRNRPDWPFIVRDELKQIQPELFKSTEQGPAQNADGVTFQDCHPLMKNPSIHDSEVSECGLSVENASVSDEGSVAFSTGDCLTPENSSVLSGESFPKRGGCLTAENSSVLSGESFPKSDGCLHVENSSVLSDMSALSIDQYASVLNPSIMSCTDSEFMIRRFMEQAKGETPMVDKQSRGLSGSYDTEDYSDGEIDDEEAREGVPGLKLRAYQFELAEEALDDRNVIVCAPTGSGKTRVAMHVIIKHLEKISEKNTKKVCFFARTVPLAVQQHRVICKYLPKKYKTVLVTGDSVNCLNLEALLPENDVIVLTPMILQNHFNRGLLKDLTVFTLLVFDECHHTRKAEPYNTLMLPYIRMKVNNSRSPLPQVLGLTASLPTEKADSVPDARDSVLRVCANLAADDISTVRLNLEELRNTVPDPQEDIESLYERHDSKFVSQINFIMRSLEKDAQQEGLRINDEEVTRLLNIAEIPEDKKSQQYNQWTVNLRKAAETVAVTEYETNMAVRTLMILAKYLTEYNIALEAYDLVHLKDVLSYLDKRFKLFEENEAKSQKEAQLYADFIAFKGNMDNFQHEENPNLTKLVEILETYLLGKGEQSRGIIFVKTRALAEALTSWLRKCEKSAIVNLKATIFTGTNASESEGGMTQAEQDDCVERFRNGTIKLLIATSVAEEGIDVPECNLVMKYNYVGNEISTIQTKGRSRKWGGRSILLAMPYLRDREAKNKTRAKMMFEAVKNIQDMDTAQRLEIISSLQKKALEEQECKELSKKEEKRSDKRFRMLCRLCRKTCVDSDYVRIIHGTHRVVTDWNIWKHVTVHRMSVSSIDDIKFVGSVCCKAAVKDKAICNGSLGTVIIYKGICFFALGIKNFGFIEELRERPQFFKKWKQVKYIIKEIAPPDVARYLEDYRGDDRA